MKTANIARERDENPFDKRSFEKKDEEDNLH